MENGNRSVEFTATPTAHLRCPRFENDPESQQAWNGLWHARLNVMNRVFPWLRPAISDLRKDDSAFSYLDARTEYEKGYRSDSEHVRAIHDRQNREWTELTGRGPLGTVDDWRDVAAAAGIPPAEFQRQSFDRLADCVASWAVARRLNQPSIVEIPTSDDDETPQKWREFDRWAAEDLTPSQLSHVRALYSGPVENDALGAMHGCDPGEHSRARVNRLNSAINKKLPSGYRVNSNGKRGSVGHTQLFGP